MSASATATNDLLSWIASRRASYDEGLEVWQTSCPRLSVWEDAFIDGLVCLERHESSVEPVLALTERGRAVLDGESV